MRPFRHSKTTRVIGREDNIADDGLLVRPLPITDVIWGNTQSIVTFWKPTEEELAQLDAGGTVAVYFVGVDIPDMGVVVETSE